MIRRWRKHKRLRSAHGCRPYGAHFLRFRSARLPISRRQQGKGRKKEVGFVHKGKAPAHDFVDLGTFHEGLPSSTFPGIKIFSLAANLFLNPDSTARFEGYFAGEHKARSTTASFPRAFSNGKNQESGDHGLLGLLGLLGLSRIKERKFTAFSHPCISVLSVVFCPHPGWAVKENPFCPRFREIPKRPPFWPLRPTPLGLF